MSNKPITPVTIPLSQENTPLTKKVFFVSHNKPGEMKCPKPCTRAKHPMRIPNSLRKPIRTRSNGIRKSAESGLKNKMTINKLPAISPKSFWNRANVGRKKVKSTRYEPTSRERFKKATCRESTRTATSWQKNPNESIRSKESQIFLLSPIIIYVPQGIFLSICTTFGWLPSMTECALMPHFQNQRRSSVRIIRCTNPSKTRRDDFIQNS